MSDISLDLLVDSPTYGDLRLMDGDLLLTSDANPKGTNSILQNCVQRLRFFLAEWFLDTEKGVPWLQQILTKGTDISTVDGLLRDCILGTPGVTALLSYTGQRDAAARRYAVRFTILTASAATISGETAINTAGTGA